MADDPDIPFQKYPEALFPRVIEKLLQDGITRGILMKKKSIKIIIVTILVLILLGSLNAAYSILSRKDYGIIRVAFMNGYLTALKLDSEEKIKLENDEVLLTKTVKSAAEEYLTKVDRLNP